MTLDPCSSDDARKVDLAEKVAEAALDYRRAELLSERDPEQFLQAQRELDAVLRCWEERIRSTSPTPEKSVAAFLEQMKERHGL